MQRGTVEVFLLANSKGHCWNWDVRDTQLRYATEEKQKTFLTHKSHLIKGVVCPLSRSLVYDCEPPIVKVPLLLHYLLFERGGRAQPIATGP